MFKTRGRGWGVRTWDTIPFGAYVTSFRGLIRPHAEHEEDDTFVFTPWTSGPTCPGTTNSWMSPSSEPLQDDPLMPFYLTPAEAAM